MPETSAALDPRLLAMLRCPETLAPLALAEPARCEEIRAAVKAGTLRQRDGEAAPASFSALLLRADGKVAYLVLEGFPRLVSELAVVLDPSLGPIQPRS